MLKPNWNIPNVYAATTTRSSNYNFLLSNNDLQKDLTKWRLQYNLVADPVFLQQQHENKIVEITQDTKTRLKADASFTVVKNLAIGVLTADCLPVLLTNKKQNFVAAIHAGWRGIAKKIIAASIDKISCNAKDLYAWLGPCIGQQIYTVGIDVYNVFAEIFPKSTLDKISKDNYDGTWQLNIYLAGYYQLLEQGLLSTQIFGKPICTFTENDCYSHRKGDTQRMASIINIVS